MGRDFSLALLQEWEERIRRNTRNFLNSAYVSLIEEAFTCHGQWYPVSASSNRSDGPLQALLLHLRLRNHLWTAWDLVLKGYYLDSMNALKLAFETLFLAEHLETRPADARAWLAGSKRIRPTDVRHARPDGKELKPLYDELCDVAHPNGESHRWNINRYKDSDLGSMQITYGPMFDPELLTWTLERLRALLMASLADLRDFLKGTDFPELDQAGVLQRLAARNEIREYAQELERFRSDMEQGKSGMIPPLPPTS